MLKRLFSAVFVLSIFFQMVIPVLSLAATPVIIDQPATPAQPAIIITAFSGGTPDFFELYNQSVSPVFIGNWQIIATMQGTDPATGQFAEYSYAINLPAGWLLPKQYHMLQRGSPAANVSSYQIDGMLEDALTSRVELANREGVEEYSITPTPLLSQSQWVQHKQRTNTSLKMSGIFATDYAVKATAPTGFSDVVYMPPVSMPLKILEILPNARNCSPLDAAADCGDYIKLHNPTSLAVDVSQYRLRTDSNGIKSSSTNTFSLLGTVAPGEYITIRLRDSGEPLAITNTGGYVWLEDAYGIKTYQETMTTYPDASAAANKGMSWAFDASDGIWKWMPPAPGAPNYWPPVFGGKGGDTSSALADCSPGKERNPATNRCRNIASSASSVLTPCKAGQERNPETNRCRSVLSASTNLQPCDTGQYRNPETNRCKKNEGAAGLTPCKTGYERNPETNRCRKISVASKDIPDVKDVESKTKASMTSWWFAGAAALAALGYGIYEWRHDIMQRLKGLKQ